MGSFTPAPPAAVTRVLMQWDRETLAAFVAVAIDLMDVADGDEDEGDPLNEDEPAFDRATREIANRHGHGAGDPISGDAEPTAWIERLDQTRYAMPRLPFDGLGNLDDVEEDDEDCDGFENEPLFDRRECKRLSRMYGDGPGGGNLLDSDYGLEGE